VRSFRTGWPRALGALILAAVAGCGSPEPQAAIPPNIVLIITDDQGWAQVGWRGNEILQTPNLDRLAGESVEFTRFYASPVCAPTRASLMTGRYNYRTGVVDTYLGRAMMHSDERTLPEMLGSAGYRSGIFGKWHLGDNYPMRPQDQGFDEVLVHGGGGIGQPSDPPGNSYFDPILRQNGVEREFKGYCTDIFFHAAMDFIERNREQPFFAYIATNAPHSPYLAPDSYIEPYKAKGLDEKDARIYGMITNIDDNVGRLVTRLADLGLVENTILIFMTDNGPTTRHFTAGLRAEKGSVYEGGIRVPLLLRWPARLQHAVVDRIAAHIDLAPTLLEAAGIGQAVDVKFDGVSFLPLLPRRDRTQKSKETSHEAGPERAIYIQSHRGNEPVLYRNFAAITQRYKLVQPLSFSDPMPEGAALELYDLEADPGESRNIAGEHPDLVAGLKSGYEAWFRDVSASRGYEPPRIFLGSDHENPAILTRQDWRMVGPDGWGDGDLGYWHVDVRSSGTYEIRLRFPPQETAGMAQLKLGRTEQEKSFAAGETSVSFDPLLLQSGPGVLEACLVRGAKTAGVGYVDVRRVK
jgi:arylsulfatase A-like enzyme